MLDHGERGRHHRANLLFHGPPEAVAEIVREARAREAIVEVLHQGPGSVSLSIETPLDAGPPAPGLAALPSTLAHHGLHALIDPIVAADGRVRVRFVVPRQTDPQEMLRALQEIPRACGFADFRIQRIGTLAPATHIECTRRALPPEQETLLSLAAAMGYYETPKVVTLEKIARAVGLSISPVHKRLKAAEETIVGQHVAPAPPRSQRRRPARGGNRIEPTSPWEVHLRVRADIGPAAFLAQTPGARAAMHVLSADASSQTSLLVVVAPDEAQTKLLASLEDRPEIERSSVIERAAEHVVCRLETRDRGAYALGWWPATWGNDAALRSVVFHEGEAHLRSILARPHTPDKLTHRLEESAHSAGWHEWELVSLQPLSKGAPPASWPEPLTQRQLEVLRVAYALGYYRTPRACTLEQVAKTLGVSANAIHKNLVLAESKLIAAYLAGGA